MNQSPVLVGALAGGFSWIFGYTVTIFLLHGLSSITVYGVLVGWWSTAYVSSLVRIPALAALPLFFFHYIIFLIVAMSGRSWLYSDIHLLTIIGIFEVGAIQAFIICSPIIFNVISMKLLDVILGNFKCRNE